MTRWTDSGSLTDSLERRAHSRPHSRHKGQHTSAGTRSERWRGDEHEGEERDERKRAEEESGRRISCGMRRRNWSSEEETQASLFMCPRHDTALISTMLIEL